MADLALPAYSSTFSAQLTRGYWFKAPVDFTIVQLRVPTDVGTEPQHLAVVRFTAQPPEFSNTTNAFTTLFYKKSISGTNYETVSIVVKKDEFIGVLGARGTSTMNNSYAVTGNFTSSIKGQSVTLVRLNFQDSLITSAPTALSSSNAGQMGRVEMKYK